MLRTYLLLVSLRTYYTNGLRNLKGVILMKFEVDFEGAQFVLDDGGEPIVLVGLRPLVMSRKQYNDLIKLGSVSGKLFITLSDK